MITWIFYKREGGVFLNSELRRIKHTQDVSTSVFSTLLVFFSNKVFPYLKEFQELKHL